MRVSNISTDKTLAIYLIAFSRDSPSDIKWEDVYGGMKPLPRIVVADTDLGPKKALHEAP